MVRTGVFNFLDKSGTQISYLLLLFGITYLGLQNEIKAYCSQAFSTETEQNTNVVIFHKALLKLHLFKVSLCNLRYLLVGRMI